jgi:hypothetical protein
VKFEKLVKVALDELRMEMLGVQVLFGFQMQGVFQDGFDQTPLAARWADAAALSLVVLTLGLLIAVPSQHRLVDRGCATKRVFRVAHGYAKWALASLALTIALDFFVVVDRYLPTYAVLIAIGAGFASVACWYGLGAVLRLSQNYKEDRQMPAETATDIHAKIEQMLTEARVILPGAQALLGFQFVVTMSKSFSQLASINQHVHFAALCAVAFSVMLLITPAAVHRMTFGGQDVLRFHQIGSFIVTLALIPLACGIAADFYIAASRMVDSKPLAATAAGMAFFILAILWYGIPLALRQRR